MNTRAYSEPIILAISTATSSVSCALARGENLLAHRASDKERSHAESLVPFIAELTNEAGIAVADIELVAVNVGPGLFTGLRVGITTAITFAHALGVATIGLSSLKILANIAKISQQHTATHPSRPPLYDPHQRLPDGSHAPAHSPEFTHQPPNNPQLPPPESTQHQSAELDRTDTPTDSHPQLVIAPHEESSDRLGRIDAVIDARRGEFFHAAFDCNLKPLSEPAVTIPTQLTKTLEDLNETTLLVGDCEEAIAAIKHGKHLKEKGRAPAATQTEAIAAITHDKHLKVNTLIAQPDARAMVALAAQATMSDLTMNPADIKPIYIRQPDARPIQTPKPQL